MKKNLIIGCMAVFAVSVQAQEGWTLRQCIDYAIEHNISIRQSANEAEQSAVSVNTAKWARLPNLNGSAGQSWLWGRFFLSGHGNAGKSAGDAGRRSEWRCRPDAGREPFADRRYRQSYHQWQTVYHSGNEERQCVLSHYRP